jgi:hypothetical protein
MPIINLNLLKRYNRKLSDVGSKQANSAISPGDNTEVSLHTIKRDLSKFTPGNSAFLYLLLGRA